MAVVVQEMTMSEAKARRDEVLAQLGGDQEAVDSRARDYVLSEREAALYDQLQRLNYLLGGE